MSLHRLINKVKQTATTERKTRSGRLRTATTEAIKQYVEKAIASLKECLVTHKFHDKLQLSMQSVQRITTSLGFKAFKKIVVSRRDTNFRTKRPNLM